MPRRRSASGVTRGRLCGRVSVKPTAKSAKDAKVPLSATFRTTKPTPSGKLLVTSADLPHLMPIIAVAPRGFIKEELCKVVRRCRADDR